MDPVVYPLISVLIPMYNHESFIEKCLDSIVEDSYTEKEIVVIDDGSSDSSVAVVRSWYERNAAKVGGRFELRTRENRGVTRTLNELVSLAEGEFIAFVSSDDYLLPGSLTARMNYLLAHPDKMAVVSDYVVVDQNNSVIHASGIETLYHGRKAYLIDPELISYELIFNWCLAGPVYMYRRELFRLLGGHDEDLLIEDWDFVLRILSRKLMGFIDYPGAAYRLHGANSIYDKSRIIEHNHSLLITVSKHIGAFTGIKKLFLYGTKLKLIGAHAKLTGRNRLRGTLYRRAGRTLISLAKGIYHRSIPVSVK